MVVRLLSHGTLCKEMYESLKLIVGDVSNFGYILQPEDGNLSEYEGDLKSMLDENDEILVLTDLMGGSPLISLAKIYSANKSKYSGHVKIVTGMNLGMLLEVNAKLDHLSLNELATDAVKAGKSGIVDFLEQIEGKAR